MVFQEVLYFPETVLRDINANYDYDRNTSALEKLAEQRGFDLNTRDSWIHNLTPGEREALIKTQKMSQIPAWQRIFGSKITGLGLGALGGATAGHELYKAVEEGKQGDYLGSALSGLTGLSGMAAMVPNPVVAGIGGALAAGIPIARELVPRNIESMKRLANRPRGEAPTPAEIAEASSAYYGRGALPRKRTMIAGID